MNIKQKLEDVVAVLAHKPADTAEYEICVFYDAANDSHAMVHQKLSIKEGVQDLKIERWSHDHFVEVAA